MAVDLTADAYYTTAGAAVVGVPITLSVLANPDAVTGGAEGMFLTQAAEGSATSMHSTLLWHINDRALYSIYDTSGPDILSSFGALSADTWTHLCGVSETTTDHRLYIDGSQDGSSATSADPVPDTIGVGVQRGNSVNNSVLTGRTAEAAIWNVALTDPEIAALAKGFSPRLIRPASLRAHYIEHKTNFAGTDMSGNGNDLGTTIGTPADFPHPRVIRPSRQSSVFVPAAVVGGLSIPVAMHEYRQRHQSVV